MPDDPLLEAYDRELRRAGSAPGPGWTVERTGQVLRLLPPADAGDSTGAVVWSDLDEGNADDVIREQQEVFRAAGRGFEWKWHGYDAPLDLPQRLVRAGFEPETEEALMAGEVSDVLASTAGASPPPQVRVRRLEVGPGMPAELARIRALKEEVWGGHWGWLVSELGAEAAADPASVDIWVAEAGDDLVSAGWVRFPAGSAFATLWGGATLEPWRRRGIYRALVHRRAVEARGRGRRYLQVDASPDSRPILERLGMRRLTSTTPYLWRP